MRLTKKFFRVSPLIFASLLMVASFALAANKKSDVVKKDKVDESTTTSTTVQKSNQQSLDDLKNTLQKAAPAGTSRTGEQINWFVISAGATNGSSTNYALMGTVGQTAVGSGSSTNYSVNQGFWQNFSGGGCCDLAGDFNDDGSVDITDLTDVVDFMFSGGPGPACNDEADINADGSIDITDLTDRVDFMFGGGPAPVCGTSGS